MKRLLICSLFFGMVISLRAQSGEGFTPQAFGIKRYEHIWVQSPFVVETPVVQASSGLEQRFVLTGVASLNSTPVVFLFDRETQNRIMITPDSGKNPQGIKLLTVEPNADPRLARATIRRGAEQGTIRYSDDALKAPSTAAKGKSGEAEQPASPSGNPESSAVADGAGAAAPTSIKFIRRPTPINPNR